VDKQEETMLASEKDLFMDNRQYPKWLLHW